MRYLSAYGTALVIFLALDGLWLGLIARGFYMERMGSLMADPPRWGVAASFYLIFVIGLVYFAISGPLASGDWKSALFNGALFGFFCYLTYDGTNLSVLKGYDTTLAVVDTVWGTALSAVTSAATVAILSAFGKTT